MSPVGTSPGTSPPTRRVIAVMECLAGHGSGLSVTELAAALGIARPTATAILAELESAGWVRRDSTDLTYSVGGRFLSMSTPAPDVADVHGTLERLSAELDCGLTLSRVEPDRLVVVHKVQPRSRPIRGLNIGEPLRLAYPTGAAVLAWRNSSDQRQWLATAGAVSIRERRQLLRSARERRVVLYRPAAEDVGLLGVLIELLDAAGADGQRPEVQQRVYRQIQRLVARTYTDAEIDAPETLPLSHLTTPVFDAAGDAHHELQVAPLRADVTASQRRDVIARTLAAAEELRGIA